MKTILSMILFAALLFNSLSAFAAPKAVLWDRWIINNSQSNLKVDHKPWDLFLEANVVKGEDGINRVIYGEVTDENKIILDSYLTQLSLTPVSKLNRMEQFAFWINLYNALTVKVILEHYPVESIRDIDTSPGFFSNGPWRKKLIKIEDVKISLNDIEHRILRPIWKDPRIHYAVNCASIGCPNLQKLAFTAENVDRLLTTAAKEYINHPRGIKITDGKLLVSSIYIWFSSDFGSNYIEILSHLKQYASPDLKVQLEQFNKISSHGYDWVLNKINDSI